MIGIYLGIYIGPNIEYTPHITRDALPHGFPIPVFPAFQAVAMHDDLVLPGISESHG